MTTSDKLVVWAVILFISALPFYGNLWCVPFFVGSIILSVLSMKSSYDECKKDEQKNYALVSPLTSNQMKG